MIVVEVLHGGLESAEEEAGLFGIDSGSGERPHDLGQRELDGAVVFKHGELKRLVGWSFRGSSKGMQAGVVVAVGLVFEGGSAADVSVGFDVSTFEDHFFVPSFPKK